MRIDTYYHRVSQMSSTATNDLNCKYNPSRLGSAIGSQRNPYKREEFFTTLLLDCYKARDENTTIAVLNSIRHVPDASLDAEPTKESQKGDIRLMKGVIDIAPQLTSTSATEAIDLTDDDDKRPPPKGSSDDEEIALKRKQRTPPSTTTTTTKTKKFIQMSNTGGGGGGASQYEFNVFLKFFGAPTYISTALWYESLISQFVLPYVVPHTPHILLPMYNIYNLSAEQLKDVSNVDLRTRLQQYASKISSLSVKKQNTFGVTIMSDSNRMAKSSNTSSVNLFRFLLSPSTYLVKYGTILDAATEQEARHTLFSIIFRVLYTLEVMNRKLIRHNDMHPGNILLVNYMDGDMRANTFTYHIDPTYSPTTKQGVEPRVIQSNWMPYIIDWDRAWVYDLKLYNTLTTANSNLCSAFGQCARMNPYYDTFMFLMSIKRSLETLFDADGVTPLAYDPLREKMKLWFQRDFLGYYIAPASIAHYVDAAKKIVLDEKTQATKDRWEYVAYDGQGDAQDLDQHCRSTYDLLQLPLFSELFGGSHNPTLASFEWAVSRDIVYRFTLPLKIDAVYERELKLAIEHKVALVEEAITKNTKKISKNVNKSTVPSFLYTELSNITRKNFSSFEDAVIYKHVLTQTE